MLRDCNSSNGAAEHGSLEGYRRCGVKRHTRTGHFFIYLLWVFLFGCFLVFLRLFLCFSFSFLCMYVCIYVLKSIVEAWRMIVSRDGFSLGVSDSSVL